MSVRDRLERVARAAAARPLPVLLTVALLAVAGGLLALRLEPSTGAETLASRSSDAFKATDELHQRFGDDAVVVLIDEHVANLVLTADLGRTIRLEGCLGGNVPKGARPYGGTSSPCAGLAKLKPVKLVYGPGTFLNESVRAVQTAVTTQLQALQQQVASATAAAREQAAEPASTRPPSSRRPTPPERRHRRRPPTRSSGSTSPPASRASRRSTASRSSPRSSSTPRAARTCRRPASPRSSRAETPR